MSKIARFEEEYPSLDSYWRSIILFGKNSASYKTEEQRVHFLKTIDKFAINRMIHRWETEQVKELTF